MASEFIALASCCKEAEWLRDLLREVHDMALALALADYIGVMLKVQCPIVERLTNSLMMHGRNNGKKLMAVRIVKHVMEIIHLLTDLNPIQVVVDAIINSGPKEDATRIGSVGSVRRQAVDISPLRRVNQAIYLLTTGARESAFRNIKTIAECLAC
ncbi:40S ribosomal protein S5 [Spinacia oleracea]|uniref:40S ribosomal protein S5 n=1 Tax=Spinacia oleracea TaxID=3562 RepID=A0ABM3RS41_SPIOL|nr:40S ribosomal protein S5-like [Spinacia oleracea]